MIRDKSKLRAGEEPHSLELRVRFLAPEVDESIRLELRLLVDTLHVAKAPVAVVDAMNRLGLMLVRLIYKGAGRQVPGDNLFECLMKIGPYDAKGNHRKESPEDLIPKDVDAWWQPIRIISNKASHGLSERQGLVLDAAAARVALDAYMMILKWYYTNYEFGPCLPSIYTFPRTKSIGTRGDSRPQRWWIPAGLLIGLLVCVGVVWSVLVSAAESRARIVEASKVHMVESAKESFVLQSKAEINLIQQKLEQPQTETETNRLIERMRFLAAEATKKNLDAEANFWDGIALLCAATFTDPRSNPFPKIDQAARLFNRAWSIGQDPGHKSLRADLVRVAETVIKTINQKQNGFDCPSSIRKEIIESLAPIRG